MWLAGALDAVLAIIALRREKLRHLVNAAYSTAPIGPGGKVDGLADPEFMLAQRVLRDGEKVPRPARTTEPENLFLQDSWQILPQTHQHR